MPRPMKSGRARISLSRPRAMGESDRSGFWYNLDDMVRQFQWTGNTLMDTGLLVGPDEVDTPQEQFRTPILPADPFPVVNPRRSQNVTPIASGIGLPLPTPPDTGGFSVYQLGVFRVDGLDVPPPSTPSQTFPSFDFSKPGNSMYIGLL